jgi:hypothetical protein
MAPLITAYLVFPSKHLTSTLSVEWILSTIAYSKLGSASLVTNSLFLVSSYFFFYLDPLVVFWGGILLVLFLFLKFIFYEI